MVWQKAQFSLGFLQQLFQRIPKRMEHTRRQSAPLQWPGCWSVPNWKKCSSPFRFQLVSILGRIHLLIPMKDETDTPTAARKNTYEELAIRHEIKHIRKLQKRL